MDLATRDQMREALQTDDGYMFEIHDGPILVADETRMRQDNEPVLSSILRPADQGQTNQSFKRTL